MLKLFVSLYFLEHLIFLWPSVGKVLCIFYWLLMLLQLDGVGFHGIHEIISQEDIIFKIAH